MQTKDEQQAETLLQAYKGQLAARQQADATLKQLTTRLQQLADKHPEWFAHTRTRSFTHGKLAWIQRNEVHTPADFDIEAFYAMFPKCVRLSASLSRIQQALAADAPTCRAIQQLGVEVKPAMQFSVKA
jgi:hypothetical protein